jgi:hypothetical protein
MSSTRDVGLLSVWSTLPARSPWWKPSSTSVAAASCLPFVCSGGSTSTSASARGERVLNTGSSYVDCAWRALAANASALTLSRALLRAPADVVFAGEPVCFNIRERTAFAKDGLPSLPSVPSSEMK